MQDQVPLKTRTTTINSLYNSYAAMLLGYIQEIVKDRKQAEEYLVKIFCDIARQGNEIDWDESNNWCQLQRYAKTELAGFTHAVEDCATPVTGNNPANKYLDQMSEAQKQVFCSVYYNKKTTAQLSKELNKTEEVIKKTLKEAFAIIRGQHGN